MKMDRGLDTGPVFARLSTPITETETGQTLHDRLSGLGAKLLQDQLLALLADSLSPEPQPADSATYARMLTREDGRLDWSASADSLARRIRGFYPWPGAFTRTNPEDKLLKLFPPVVVREEQAGPPGAMVI